MIPHQEGLTIHDLAAAAAIRLGYVSPSSLVDGDRLSLDVEQAACLLAPVPQFGWIVQPVVSHPGEAVAEVESGKLLLVNQGTHLKISAGVLGQPTVLPVASNALIVKVTQ